MLVGTQMVAKGHDFPDVSLGVVLDADQTLRFPDFRAEERTFALITQLAGRTGRGALASRVLVQTLAPDARPIGFATRHDSDGFIADELERRRALSYPPYASLIRIVCSAHDEALARETADAIHVELAGHRRGRARTGAAVSPARPGPQPARHQGPGAPVGDRHGRAGRRPRRPAGRSARRRGQRRRRSPVISPPTVSMGGAGTIPRP